MRRSSPSTSYRNRRRAAAARRDPVHHPASYTTMPPRDPGPGMLAAIRARESATPEIVSRESTGAELAAELPQELALLAWEALRSVLKWTQEEPAFRREIFEPNAMREWEVQLLQSHSASELYRYVAVLIGELAQPSDASSETLAQACICVTEWALEGQFVVTALAFVEAAALSWPENPRYAWIAGHLMQAHGRPREATVWLKRAERAASSRGDRLVQVLALRSRGQVHCCAGRDREAGKVYRQALRVARRHDVHEQVGNAAHDLFQASSNLAAWDETEEHARIALEAYKSGSPRLTVLALDVACSWIAQGFYGRALEVLQHLTEKIDVPGERIRAQGALAHAAGVLGDDELFSAAVGAVWSLAAVPDALPSTGIALVGVARGATHLQHWDIADKAAARAAELAGEQGRPELAAEAEAVRMRAETAPPRHPEDEPVDSRVNAFAIDLLAALRTQLPAGQQVDLLVLP